MFIDRILFSARAPKVLRKALDFQSQRLLLITSNISNLDTPGYKAKDIDFSKQLKEAIGSRGSLALAGTHQKHFAGNRNTVAGLEPDVFEEPEAAKSNGNNVNIDKEMMKLSENQIHFNATVQLLAKRASTIRAAITEIAQ